MDALRAEFPSASTALAPFRRLSVARSSVGTAFLAGVGAAFIVRAIAQLVVALLFPLIFPATSPHPTWVTPALFWNGAGEFAAGLVLMRAAGLVPLGLYALLELLVLLAALPGRLLFCANAVGTNLLDIQCDFPSMVVARWPLWLALLLGALAFRALRRRDDGEDQLLAATGAFSLVVTAVTSIATVAFSTAGTNASELTFTGLYAVGEIVAGLVAGALLWRSTLARPLVLALCLIGPALALSLPGLRTTLAAAPTNPQPAGYYLSLWASVLIPAFGAIAVFAGRALRREWGTIF